MPVTVYVLPDSDPVTPEEAVAVMLQFADTSADPRKTLMVVSHPL
jgi:hypothetical protein